MATTTRSYHAQGRFHGTWKLAHDLDTSDLATARDRFGRYKVSHGHCWHELQLVRVTNITKVMAP